MKKIVALILSAAMLALMIGCTSKNQKEISVYFKAREKNELNLEKRKIELHKKNSAKEIAKAAVSELLKGPQNEANEALLPKDTKLLSLEIENNVATVNMSKEFGTVKGTDAILQRLSMVNTLCAISGIEGIVIQTDGKPIVSENTGKEFGVLTLSNITYDMDETSAEKKSVTLYFPRKDGEGLVKEKRNIEIQKALSMEKAVVSELIKGTKNKKASKALSQDTKIIGIETKDNVCFVNFSNEFVTKTQPTSLATELTLYSVVNSLCELENVKSVQILVNGETGVEFGNYVLDIPYEPDNELIK